MVLPAIVLQSVLIGGGYATGREIVAYGAKFGAGGWVAVLVVFAGFTLMSFLTFEVARLSSAYEYKGFIREHIGRAWPRCSGRASCTWATTWPCIRRCSSPSTGRSGAGILLAAALLSRVGIIALVSRGYTVMGYAFIALFALPLLTVGARKVWLAGR